MKYPTEALFEQRAHEAAMEAAARRELTAAEREISRRMLTFARSQLAAMEAAALLRRT